MKLLWTRYHNRLFRTISLCTFHMLYVVWILSARFMYFFVFRYSSKKNNVHLIGISVLVGFIKKSHFIIHKCAWKDIYLQIHYTLVRYYVLWNSPNDNSSCWNFPKCFVLSWQQYKHMFILCLGITKCSVHFL